MTTTDAVVLFAQVSPPGLGVFDRLGDSIQAFAAPLLLVAFLVIAFVLLLRQIPGVVLVLLGFVLLSSMLLNPGPWFDWVSYVATGTTTTDTDTSTGIGVFDAAETGGSTARTFGQGGG